MARKDSVELRHKVIPWVWGQCYMYNRTMRMFSADSDAFILWSNETAKLVLDHLTQNRTLNMDYSDPQAQFAMKAAELF